MCLPSCRRFNTLDLSNSLYLVGLLGVQLPPPARRAFMAALCQRSGAMNPQEHANTLLGLAYQYRRRHRQEEPPPEVEAAAVELLRAAAKRLHAMKHQELANAAWAFSKVSPCRGWRRSSAAEKQHPCFKRQQHPALAFKAGLLVPWPQPDEQAIPSRPAAAGHLARMWAL